LNCTLPSQKTLCLSLPSLYEPKIGSYHEPHKSSQKVNTLFIQDLELSYSCIQNENLYIFLTAHTHSICPSNLSFLYLVTLIFHKNVNIHYTLGLLWTNHKNYKLNFNKLFCAKFQELYTLCTKP
jgi:hypothetical protein